MNYLVIDNINNYSYKRNVEENRCDCFSTMIASYINNTKDNCAELYDASENDFILNHYTDTKFESYIIRVNEDNINSILRLNKNMQHKKTFFFSVNENLNEYFTNEQLSSYFNFNERETLKHNFLELNKLLKITDSEIDCINLIKKCSIDITKKSMNVNIGKGCNRACSFCSISKSSVEYYELSPLICEIKENIERGVNYFHINNHNFTSDMDYVKNFCNILNKECSNIPFKWSCFIIPENIIHNIEILSLLRKSKLEKVEISVENVNNKILNDFELNVQLSDIINIIDVCQKVGISAITINYIIGSTNESKETLLESRKFLELLISKTCGKIDFNLSFFYPDIDTKYNNYQIPQGRMNIVNRCIKRKQSCLLDTKYLSKMDIYSWMWNMTKYINNYKQQKICEITPKERINIYQLSIEYGIKSQLNKFLLSTSLPLLFEKKRLYHKRSSRNITFFIDEIKANIESYTPQLASEHYLFLEGENIYINPDSIFLINKKESFINLSEFNLYKAFMSESSVKDIIDYNYNGDNSISELIINRLKELENVHLIYYAQILI